MDRPIKYNPKGKYNLNFIDWTNEYEAIMEGHSYDPNNVTKGPSPIYGMPMDVFHSLIL